MFDFNTDRAELELADLIHDVNPDMSEGDFDSVMEIALIAAKDDSDFETQDGEIVDCTNYKHIAETAYEQHCSNLESAYYERGDYLRDLAGNR